MRDIPTALAADLANEVTTLCRLWRVTRANGTILRFTDATRDLIVGGFVYRADVSFTCSAIVTTISTAGQSVTVTVVMDDSAISEGDVRAGLYLDALGELFLCNYAAPQHGVLNLYAGNFGTIKLTDKKRAQIEHLPIATTGRMLGVETFSATCRNSWGDARCNFDNRTNPNDFRATFTVRSLSSSLTFNDPSLIQPDDYFTQGLVQWLTGLNAGQVSTVRGSARSGGSISIVGAPLSPIAIGDTGYAFPGCDKTRTTCRKRYNNLRNMRAESDMPNSLQVQVSDPTLTNEPSGNPTVNTYALV